MIDISIITPAYNAEKYIGKCIESILKQNFKNFEHIIVNDGSSDKTGSICDQYAKKDKRIKVIHKTNEGVSVARNTALNVATGKYILFADADDWLEDTMLEEMFKVATEKDSDIVICEYYNFYENNNKKEHIKLPKVENKTFAEIITNDANHYGGFPWNKLIKRSKLKKYFDNDIHYYENLLLFLENFGNETKYDVIFKPLYNYCINDGSAVHNKKFNVKKITALKALEKIIPIVPLENRDVHKTAFITNYYVCWYGIKKEKMSLNLIEKDYKNICKAMFFDVIKSKYINLNKKIKLCFVHYLPHLYYFAKTLKETKG